VDSNPGALGWHNFFGAGYSLQRIAKARLTTSNGHCGTIKAKLTELIRPDAVFMVYGFGHTLPVESQALGKGVADHGLMVGGLALWDQAGVGMALQEHFVAVRKLSQAQSDLRKVD
jgi:hypothetical protein